MIVGHNIVAYVVPSTCVLVDLKCKMKMKTGPVTSHLHITEFWKTAPIF